MIRTVLSLTAIVALISMSGPVLAQNQEVIAKLRQFSSDGKKAFEAQEFDKAAAAFKGFIELLPKERPYNETRAHAHYYLACSFSHLKKSSESLDNLELAFKNLDDHGKLEGMLEFAREDPDLANIRSDAKFAGIVTKYQKAAAEKLNKFDFDLKDIEGKQISKKNYLGKVLVVDFWGTWCPPCRKGLPHYIELQKKYAKEGLQVIGLNSERGFNQEQNLATVKQAVKNFGINYPCALATNDILTSVNVQAFPTTLFIGRDGTVRKMVRGYHPYSDLEKYIKPLLAEKPPAPAEKKGADKGGEAVKDKVNG